MEALIHIIKLLSALLDFTSFDNEREEPKPAPHISQQKEDSAPEDSREISYEIKKEYTQPEPDMDKFLSLGISYNYALRNQMGSQLLGLEYSYYKVKYNSYKRHTLLLHQSIAGKNNSINTTTEIEDYGLVKYDSESYNLTEVGYRYSNNIAFPFSLGTSVILEDSKYSFMDGKKFSLSSSSIGVHVGLPLLVRINRHSRIEYYMGVDTKVYEMGKSLKGKIVAGTKDSVVDISNQTDYTLTLGMSIDFSL